MLRETKLLLSPSPTWTGPCTAVELIAMFMAFLNSASSHGALFGQTSAEHHRRYLSRQCYGRRHVAVACVSHMNSTVPFGTGWLVGLRFGLRMYPPSYRSTSSHSFTVGSRPHPEGGKNFPSRMRCLEISINLYPCKWERWLNLMTPTC